MTHSETANNNNKIIMIWMSVVQHRMVVKCSLCMYLLKFSDTMILVVAVCHFEYFLCAVIFFFSFSFYCLRAPNLFASAHIYIFF